MTAGVAWPSAERLPRVLVTSAIAYTMTLAALHVLWILTGAAPWIASFTSLISVFFVLATGLSVVLSLAARRYFGPSDPLRQAWTLLVVASAVRLTGHIIRHVLGHTTLADAPTAAFLVHLGQVVAGPTHTVLVAAALARVTYVCWRLRMLVRPAALDVVLRGATILFTARFLYDLSQWYAARTPPTALDVLGWTSDHFSHSCSSKRSCCGVRQWRWAQGWSRGSGERLRPRSS